LKIRHTMQICLSNLTSGTPKYYSTFGTVPYDINIHKLGGYPDVIYNMDIFEPP